MAIAIHAFHKIYLNIKMPDFEVKMKIFLVVFFKYTRQRYIIQHQILNKLNSNSKFLKLYQPDYKKLCLNL